MESYKVGNGLPVERFNFDEFTKILSGKTYIEEGVKFISVLYRH